MTPRRLIPVWALVAALTATSCATFENSRRIAGVGGEELTEETFAEMLDSPLGAQIMGAGPIDGVVRGDASRGLIGAWIAFNAIDAAGLVGEEARAAATEQAGAEIGENWEGAPGELRDLVVLSAAVTTLVQNGELSQDEVQQTIEDADVTVSPRYGRWEPGGGGVVPLG